jgi:hypothetical protein
MEVKARVLKKHNSNNHFGMCYMPIDSGKTTFYSHKKGIIGISFINDVFGNKIILEFIKDEIEYSARIKEFKSDRSLALLVSKFHLEIEKQLLNK